MKIVLSLLFLILPIVWSRYVNGNYLSTKTFLFYFASSLALLALPARLKIRNIPKAVFYLLPIIFLYYLTHTIYELNYSEILSVFKMLSFCFIAVYIYSLCTNVTALTHRLSLYLAAMWSVIIGIGLWQIIDFRFYQGVDGVYKTLGSFGNVNMFAEFLILTLPFLFFWLKQKQDTVPYFIKLLFFSFSVFLIVYTGSRSAWLGALIWLLILAARYLKKIEWVSISIAIAAALITFHTTPNLGTLPEEKNYSIGIRSSLYSAGLQLMKDRPFGIRPGQFMNEIVPYLMNEKVGPQEFSYFDQPHSEPIKWGVQQGIPFLILSLSALVIIFYYLVRNFIKSNREADSEPLFYLGSFITAAPQIAFQFPFENPSSAMFLAIVLGLWLSKFSESGKHIDLRWVFPAIGLASILGVINAFLFAFSIILESHYGTSPDIMNIVCKAYPANFRACHLKNRSLFDLKNIQAFRQEFKTDFLNNPFFCDNLRLLPEYFNYANSEKKTCESLLLYNQIFKNQKTFKIEAMPACQRYTSPVQYKDAKQFNEEFRQWFAESRQ